MASYDSEEDCTANGMFWADSIRSCLYDGDRAACLGQGFDYQQCEELTKEQCQTWSSSAGLGCHWNLRAECENQEMCEAQGACNADLFLIPLVEGSEDPLCVVPVGSAWECNSMNGVLVDWALCALSKVEEVGVFNPVSCDNASGLLVRPAFSKAECAGGGGVCVVHRYMRRLA